MDSLPWVGDEGSTGSSVPCCAYQSASSSSDHPLTSTRPAEVRHAAVLTPCHPRPRKRYSLSSLERVSTLPPRSTHRCVVSWVARTTRRSDGPASRTSRASIVRAARAYSCHPSV
jgi:hypothetical protein